MTGVWFAPLPRCPGHGQMHWDRTKARWICRGWDGEGCGYTAEGPDPASWTYLGRAETIIPGGDLL